MEFWRKPSIPASSLGRAIVGFTESSALPAGCSDWMYLHGLCLGQRHAGLPFSGLGLGCTVSPGFTQCSNSGVSRYSQASIQHASQHPVRLATLTTLTTQSSVQSGSAFKRMFNKLVIYHVTVCNALLQPLGRRRIHASHGAGCPYSKLNVVWLKF